MNYSIKAASSSQALVFLMIDSTDHVTGKTGLSPTVTLSKNGAAFGSPSGAVTEISSGWYKVAGNSTDTATVGPLVLHATGTGADPTDIVYEVVAYDPQDSVRLGLTALPNAAAAASGGLPTIGATIPNATAGAAGGIFIAGTNAATTITTALTTTFTGNLTGNVGGNVTGTVGSIVSPGNIWDVVNTGATHNVTSSTGKQLRSISPTTAVIYTGTAPSQAGMTSTQIKLDSGASAVDNVYQWNVISLTGGTDAGDSRIITAYVGSTRVATVNAAWTLQPDNTSVFEVTPTAQVQVVSYITGQAPLQPVVVGRQLAVDSAGRASVAIAGMGF